MTFKEAHSICLHQTDVLFVIMFEAFAREGAALPFRNSPGHVRVALNTRGRIHSLIELQRKALLIMHVLDLEPCKVPELMGSAGVPRSPAMSHRREEVAI